MADKSSDNQRKVEQAKRIAKASSTSFKKTYNRVENVFVRGFKSVSDVVDRILFNHRYAKLIAVVIATALVLGITNNSDNNLFTNKLESAVTINNVIVTSNASSSVYEVSGLPQSVSATVSGDTNDVQTVSGNRSNLQVSADLASLDEGTHEVSLTPVNFSSKVDVTLTPSSAVVTIKKKVSQLFKLSYDFINENKMYDIYVLGDVSLSQNDVIVRASQDTMDTISFVKALIDVNGVKADFTQEAIIVAYNQKGEQVSADIIPSSVSATVKVSSPHKDVGINVVTSGKMASGKAISSYELSDDKITLYAKQSILDTIDSIDVTIPIDKISKDKEITVPIVLPEGVQSGSINKVNVKLKVGNSSSKTIDNIPITYSNVTQGYEASSETTSGSVTISGYKDIIDKLTAGDLKIVSDMSELTNTGTYWIKLKASGSNKLVKYKVSPKRINVTLKKKGE